MIEPATRAGNWMDRHHEFAARAREGGVDVLFLGDSITDSWRSTGLETWDRCFASLNAANFGIWGDGSANLLWRVLHGELEGIVPKVTVVLIGTNDIPWEVTEGEAAGAVRHAIASVRAVVDAVRAGLPRTRLLLMGIFPREEGPCVARRIIEEVNHELVKWQDGKRLHFLDIGARFMTEERIPAEVMPDTLHLSPKGYEIWGEALLPVLEYLLVDQDG